MATSVALLEVGDIDQIRFSSGGLLAIEDFTFFLSYQIIIFVYFFIIIIIIIVDIEIMYRGVQMVCRNNMQTAWKIVDEYLVKSVSRIFSHILLYRQAYGN